MLIYATYRYISVYTCVTNLTIQRKQQKQRQQKPTSEQKINTDESGDIKFLSMSFFLFKGRII